MTTAEGLDGGVRPGRGFHSSLSIILVYWALLTARQLVHPPIPTNVRDLALRVSIEAALGLLVVWWLLRLSGLSLAILGFRPGGIRRVLAFGILVPSGLFLVGNIGLNSILSALLPHGRTTVLKTLFQDPHQAPYWVIAAVVGGGFSEELRRAFVLTRFEQLFGRVGLIVALVVDTFIFGLGHLYQGSAGAIGAGFTGLVLALIFLRRRRVIDAMLVHAVFDLMGVAAAYALYAHRT
jgi:membrane protease YdiL (CAAX protease family)